MTDTDTDKGATPGPASRVASSYTSRLTTTANSRTIFGYMAFAVLFSVIGAEIRNAQSGAFAPNPAPTALHNPTPGHGATGLVADPVAIFLGGTVATALLVLLADTGDTGRRLGVGLAGVTLAASLLVNGGPVWNAANKLMGGTPTTPLGNTNSTTPTATAGATTTTTPTAGYGG